MAYATRTDVLKSKQLLTALISNEINNDSIAITQQEQELPINSSDIYDFITIANS